MNHELQDADWGLLSTRQGGSAEVALSDEDREALKRAVQALEYPSFAARLSTLAGRPVELLGQALPGVVSAVISTATQAALTRALHFWRRYLERWAVLWGSRQFWSSCQSRRQSC